MEILESHKNYKIVSNRNDLKYIHQRSINVAIHERDTLKLNSEIDRLLIQNIRFQSSGTIDTILNHFLDDIGQGFKGIMKDIKQLLFLFQDISEKKNFKLIFSVISTNMCRRFHTDINNLRLLCTYKGEGTLWLTEDNVNRTALENGKDNASIVIHKDRIQQAKQGAIVILKGAKYPLKGTKAAVHRSPTIENTNTKRLLLRIDTI